MTANPQAHQQANDLLDSHLLLDTHLSQTRGSALLHLFGHHGEPPDVQLQRADHQAEEDDLHPQGDRHRRWNHDSPDVLDINGAKRMQSP